ncbi:MAG: quinoprotein relay system zinc metallohydrolase 2 [Burkholderiaceae bacterium]|nr:MAG: quinoprotein relay system zinc metallohydrolase 2 [Burkholderiaceae bacterium]
MAKFWITCLVIFFSFFTHAFSLEKRPYEFDTLLIHDAPSQKIYLAVEKTGYLKSVGIETGVNTLVVVKKNGSFVVDPGPHRGYVEELFDTIGTKYNTELPPVKWVFNSTAKPENVMGNYAFLKDHPTYISSEKTRQYMVENCQACRDDMMREVNQKELVASEIVIPNYIIEKNSPLHPELLDWKAISFACVKQTGDTLLWNENLKILYASEVVFNNSIPSLSKGHTKPWVRGLEFLRALKPTYVIGSGTVSSFDDFKTEALGFNIKYFSLIYEIAKKDYLLGVFREVGSIPNGLVDFINTPGFDKRHNLNYQKVSREIELEAFNQNVKCPPLSKHFVERESKQEFEGKLNGVVPLVLELVSPGVYTFQGNVAEFSRKNRGLISNFSFIEGADCIAVIDTGGSLYAGKSFISAIREISSKPICYVINTHVHPDHTGGNKAFTQLNPPPEFIVHKNFTPAYANRFNTYNKRLLELLGEKNALQPYSATKEVEDFLQLNLGDRKLTLTAWETAHTNHDLTVFDHTSQTLITGDLLFVKHIPVIDGSLNGWIKVTQQLINFFEKSPNKHYVESIIPGHGPPQNDVRGLENQLNYLVNLKRSVQEALRDNISLQKAMKSIKSESTEVWENTENYSKRNITAAYAELEWED